MTVQPAFNKIAVARSTYKHGAGLPVHRWFRLTPSFGPALVTRALEALGAPERAVVLDPFAGKGTTLIECKLRGYPSIGFEVNPLLHFACETALDWSIPADAARAGLASLRRSFSRARSRLAGVALADSGLRVPPIHRVHRWWREDVLKDLLLLKAAIARQAPPLRAFFRLCLAAVLVPDLTNVTLGRLQLHFIDRANDSIDVFPTFAEHAARMIEDLEAVCGIPAPSATIHLADNRTPPGAVPRADVVITSPPYPNRYSYVWNTRPHLYLFDFIDQKHHASEIDVKTLGGTWGLATTSLKRGTVAPASRAVASVAGPLVDRVRAADALTANYVMRYFNDLAAQIVAMDPLLAPGAKLAYVVGNSRAKGEYVETDVLLGNLLEALGLGWRVLELERFRRRNSGKDLFETVVYAAKSP